MTYVNDRKSLMTTFFILLISTMSQIRITLIGLIFLYRSLELRTQGLDDLNEICYKVGSLGPMLKITIFISISNTRMQFFKFKF